MYAYATDPAHGVDERERFDAWLEGRDLAREKRLAMAIALGGEVV